MMPNPLPSETGDFSEDLIGVNSYEPQSPEKKEFLPWHKPRKQFVRKEQWTAQIVKLLEEENFDSDVIKYLGLPGDDLLDLRYFHQLVCVPKSKKLQFLGFNSAANPKNDSGTNLNISLDEVIKLQYVDPTSDIIGDDICQIANPDSVAYDRSIKMGPYDVINIDLCDGFGIRPVGSFEGSHFNALSQLMSLQARRSKPWLLFLTTRCGPQHVDETVLRRLKDIYLHNLNNCTAFNDKSLEKYAANNGLTLDATLTNDGNLSDIFLISLSKWITSLAVRQIPPSTLELKSVVGYRVDPAVSHCDLVSLAIKIKPTVLPAADRTGLATNRHVGVDECKIAVQVFERVNKLVDADKVLADNPATMDDMVSESSALLEEARYDVSKYGDWARDAK